MKILYKINHDLLKEEIEAFLSKKENKVADLDIDRHSLSRLRHKNAISIKKLLNICNAIQVNPGSFFSSKPYKN